MPLTQEDFSALSRDVQRSVIRSGANIGEAVDLFQLLLMGAAMDLCGGNKAQAAKALLTAGEEMAAKIHEWEVPDVSRLIVPSREVERP